MYRAMVIAWMKPNRWIKQGHSENVVLKMNAPLPCSRWQFTNVSSFSARLFFFFRTVEHNTETRHFFPPQVSFIRRRQGLLRVTGMDGETDGRLNRQTNVITGDKLSHTLPSQWLRCTYNSASRPLLHSTCARRGPSPAMLAVTNGNRRRKHSVMPGCPLCLREMVRSQ